MSTQDANAVMDEVFGIFGQSTEDIAGVKKGEESESDGVKQFKPDPKKSEDGTWRGIVKFLPNIKNIKHPLVKKTTYWLEDPRKTGGHGSFRYDSPKSIGKYEKCLVADRYWSWDKSEDARLKKLAKKLSYSKKCFVLVQVLIDFQNPENNGQILPFNLPIKLQNMIESKMYPAQADIDAGEVAENVFEPLAGPVMTLKIGIKKTGDDEFRDWDQCTWHPKKFGMFINGELLVTNTTDIKNDKIKTRVIPTDATELRALQTEIVTMLKDSADLEQFKYEAPSEDMLKKVRDVLAVMEGSPVNAEPEAALQTDSKTSEKLADTAKQAEKPEAAKPEAASTQKESKDLVDDLLA